MAGPAGVHLRNTAGLRLGPGWTWETSMLRRVHPGSPWLLRLWTAWALLLLAAADGGAAGLPKAVVRLEPPWFNVLRGDSVTLHCQGPHGPGDGPTQWSRDGTPIPTQVQPHFSFKATMNDTGNYRCQTDQTSLSDPAHLNVTSDWLLLQTPRLLLREGDPLVLRCHSWKSQPLFKISFFQDGIAKWYSPANSSFFIPHANVSHGGKYHCSGFMGRNRHESHPVRIDIQGPRGPRVPPTSPSQPRLRSGLRATTWPNSLPDPAFPSIAPVSLPWLQIAFCLVMGLLFAVDTGLYFSVRKELWSSMGDLENDMVTWSKSLEDK
ncbi:low affinity immunoglobulin gamma Fc region receptor III-like isoform X1 [Artibeus jamaicensis]|uniref:low affinity immunoglobulin gamma Fc region receptor III-like isoform X1 n=1 Tax=Artibeus jamaicensis TaxID=9417 RepID=UPI00235A6366|nr:low affinity immunoglobulin gamma Fc region receptor III-like isoform X1 [Artibeus jamaicensis]